MSVQVRPALAADVDELAALAARTFPLACPPTASASDVEAFIDARLAPDSFRGYLADPRRRVAVALADGVIVGYTMLVCEPPAEDVARQLTAASAVELSKIYVDLGHHGGAVATALLGDAVGWVRDAGESALWLGTNQANLRAQRFYEKRGFTRVGVRRFRVGARWEDDYVYERVLAP